jgi:hypothetical protein
MPKHRGPNNPVNEEHGMERKNCLAASGLGLEEDRRHKAARCWRTKRRGFSGNNMKKLLHRIIFCWPAFLGAGYASESEDSLNKVLADTTSIQMELAMAQKRFSIMSRTLADPERCMARDLVDTSTNFREVTTEPLLIGQLVSAMKFVEDQTIVRSRLGTIAYRIVEHGKTDIELVNESLKGLTTPAMITEATLIRDDMIKLRKLWEPFSSGHF